MSVLHNPTIHPVVVGIIVRNAPIPTLRKRRLCYYQPNCPAVPYEGWRDRRIWFIWPSKDQANGPNCFQTESQVLCLGCERELGG